MIKLLMALSMGKYEKRTCTAEIGLIDGQKTDWNTEYETQLEPVPFFLMDHYDKAIEIVLLCSKETMVVNEENPISRYEVFKSNIEEKSKESGHDHISISPIIMDIDDEKAAIKGVVENLRTDKDYELWIDTHGGPREIAFILNSIVSLLKVYDIEVDKFVTVLPDEKGQSVIRDASESFEMLDFVAGINEFVNFGVAKTLESYLKTKEDKKLLAPICKISDGTRLCDPAMYEAGLDELGNVISSIHSQGYISLFVDYIKADYGKLLDKESRTPLDIIKRCYVKGLYQQALTFIESSMPEMFNRFGVLYYDTACEESIKAIKSRVNKGYDNVIHFVFDQFCYPIADYRNTGNERKQKAIDILGIETDSISSSFFDGCSSKVIKVTKPRTGEVVGQIKVFTAVKEEYKADAGRLIRLHKAIKECRNTINHASKESKRPKLLEIDKGIANYIKLADKVFAEDAAYSG